MPILNMLSTLSEENVWVATGRTVPTPQGALSLCSAVGSTVLPELADDVATEADQCEDANERNADDELNKGVTFLLLHLSSSIAKLISEI